MRIGEFCDAYCKVLFTKTSVTIFYKKGELVITGWRDNNGPKLWNNSFLTNEDDSPVLNQAEQTTLGVYSAYDLPSMAALVRYFHASAGHPVRSTWLNAIKNGNYSSWPGLTRNNASRYCPSAYKTIKDHMVQNRQGVRSTKTLILEHPETIAVVPAEQHTDKTTQELGSPPNKIHVRAIHTSKLYTDETVRLPFRSRIGN